MLKKIVFTALISGVAIASFAAVDAKTTTAPAAVESKAAAAKAEGNTAHKHVMKHHKHEKKTEVPAATK